jgi:hypothetical protein
MVMRLIRRLPWFLSAPVVVLAAVFVAAGMHYLAGPLFERTFRDEADPLAGVALPPASAAIAPVAPSLAIMPPASTAVHSETAGATQTREVVPPLEGAAVSSLTAPAPQPVVMPATASVASGPALLRQGEFVDGEPGHHGRGHARLIRAADGALVVRLENFAVTNGPDLFVVLSTDPRGSRASAAASDALNLGRLRASSGNLNYELPAGADADAYRSVIIYCRAFRVVFAVATLEAA